MVVAYAVLSLDVWELVMVEYDGCWTAEGLVPAAGCSCFTEEVYLALVASGN